MVACKSTAKERWRQVLHEAERVPKKYLLTVGSRLTAPTVAGMHRAGIIPFLPLPVIEANYLGQAVAEFLAPVSQSHLATAARIRRISTCLTLLTPSPGAA